MCYHYTTQKRFPFIDFIIYCILCLKCLICLFYFRILCWPSSLGGFKLCTMLLFNHHYFSFPENSLLKNKIKMSHLLFLFFPFYQGAFFFKRSWAWLVEIPRTDIASAHRLGCTPVIIQKVGTSVFLCVPNIFMINWVNFPCTFSVIKVMDSPTNLSST